MEDRDPLVDEMERARRGRRWLVIGAAVAIAVGLVVAMIFVVASVRR